MRGSVGSREGWRPGIGWAWSGVLGLSLLLVYPLLAAATASAGEARADVAPDGTSRNDRSVGLLAIASSIGPYHVRGPGEAYGEADTASGALTVVARGVNLQSATAYAQIADTFTVIPISGPAPPGPVPVTLHLDFSGDIDLDTESGDGLTSYGLTTIVGATLDHIAFPGSRTILDRARVTKTLGELTAPVSPSVNGPRTVFADDLSTDTIGDGLVDVLNHSRVGLNGTVSIPLSATVGQPIAFEASISASVASGGGYIVYNGFEDGGVLSIDLPPGFTFTSGSGVLLTTPLPEPAAAVQIAAGVLAIAGIQAGRRRRQDVAMIRAPRSLG